MSKTTNTTTSRSRRRGQTRSVRARHSHRTGSFEIFTHPQHSMVGQVLGATWRARAELLIIITLLAVWASLTVRVQAWNQGHPDQPWPLWITAAAMTILVMIILIVPVTRRFVTRRAWCVCSRHRVRRCFVQSRVMTHEGLLPLLIWSRPTPVGERLWLWLRPGLSGHDIDKVADRIAAACWARDARVRVNPKRASTVWVDIVRRDPLATSGQINSPLLDGVDPEHFDTPQDSVPLPDRATVTPTLSVDGTEPGDHIVNNPAPATRTGTTKRTGTRTATPTDNTTTSDAAVVGWSGKDVTDYV